METRFRRIIKEFAVELIIYTFLVVIYFLLVLRFLGGFLMDIFTEDIVLYTFLALGLIIMQGVLLEYITSFLMDKLNIGFESGV